MSNPDPFECGLMWAVKILGAVAIAGALVMLATAVIR